MAGPKRTPHQREHDLALIATLYLKAKTQADIAAELGIAQSQVSYDLKTIHKRWRESSLVNINEAKQRELARIDHLEFEYWRAWEGSLGEKTKTRTAKVQGSDAVWASVEKEQMLGNPAYLTGVQWCIAERCKIFGIYEATKIAITDWRQAVEEGGHNASDIFEQLVNAYVSAVSSDASADGADAA